jgi:nucleotide-binding universal stress UspA family protein
MTVVVWLTEGTWPACADAVRKLPGGPVRLLHVIDTHSVEAIDGAHAGLLGRAAGPAGPAAEEMLARAQTALFDAAVARVGRPAERMARRGRAEREVLAACADADLLILARDGDRTRLGPKSLGRATRFIVDHAPCQVLLVWPDEPPGLSTLPPPPR